MGILAELMGTSHRDLISMGFVPVHRLSPFFGRRSCPVLRSVDYILRRPWGLYDIGLTHSTLRLLTHFSTQQILSTYCVLAGVLDTGVEQKGNQTQLLMDARLSPEVGWDC
jgi:hypothetical protein